MSFVEIPAQLRWVIAFIVYKALIRSAQYVLFAHTRGRIGGQDGVDVVNVILSDAGKFWWVRRWHFSQFSGDILGLTGCEEESDGQETEHCCG
jgi:hypothetical protein